MQTKPCVLRVKINQIKTFRIFPVVFSQQDDRFKDGEPTVNGRCLILISSLLPFSVPFWWQIDLFESSCRCLTLSFIKHLGYCRLHALPSKSK